MKLIPLLFSTPMVIAVNSGIKDVTRRTKGLNRLNENPDKWKFNKQVLSAQLPNRKVLNKPFVFLIEDTTFPECEVVESPFGEPGDVLWVRETFYAYGYWFRENEKSRFEFRDITLDPVLGVGKYEYIDSKPEIVFNGRNAGAIGWHKRPSLFMPYSACRKWLEVVSVRPERLRDITKEDSIREGIEHSLPVINERKFWRNYRYSDSCQNKETPWLDSAIVSFSTLWISINGLDSWSVNPWVWRVEFKPTTKPNL